MRPHLVEYPNSSYDEDALRTGYAEVCEQICAALLGKEDKVDFDPYSPYWIGHLLDRLWGADWHDNLYLEVLLNLAADERLPALEVFAPDSGVIDRIIDGSIRTILVDAPAPAGMEAYPEAETHVGMEAYADSTPVTVPVPPDDPGRYEDYLHTLCQVVAFILRNGGDGESARWETLEHWFPYLFGED